MYLRCVKKLRDSVIRLSIASIFSMTLLGAADSERAKHRNENQQIERKADRPEPWGLWAK
jgi:hypothetical protein